MHMYIRECRDNENSNIPLHIIPFWKSQNYDITMVTSAADFGDLQPNKTMHIYPYKLNLF